MDLWDVEFTIRDGRPGVQRVLAKRKEEAIKITRKLVLAEFRVGSDNLRIMSAKRQVARIQDFKGDF